MACDARLLLRNASPAPMAFRTRTRCLSGSLRITARCRFAGSSFVGRTVNSLQCSHARFQQARVKMRNLNRFQRYREKKRRAGRSSAEARAARRMAEPERVELRMARPARVLPWRIVMIHDAGEVVEFRPRSKRHAAAQVGALLDYSGPEVRYGRAGEAMTACKTTILNKSCHQSLYS